MTRQSAFARSLRLSLAAGLTAAVLGAGAVHAQPAPRYRYVDLGPVAPPGVFLSPLTHGTFGINNHGWAVWYVLDANGDATAWVYRPNEPLVQDRIVSLASLVPGTPAVSIARDINDCGLIAGQVDGIERWEGQAVVWDLQTPQMLTAPLLPGATWSRGIAISNGTPASFVGETERERSVLRSQPG